MTLFEFKEKIKIFFSSSLFDITVDEDVLKILYNDHTKEFVLNKQDFNNINKQLQDNKSDNYFDLFYDEKYYEALIVSDSFRFLKEEELSVEDSVNHISYKYGGVSRELTLSLLLNMSTSWGTIINRRPSIALMHRIESVRSTNILDLFSEVFIKYNSLKITTTNAVSLDKIKSYAHSYTYSFMYNRQIPISLYNDIQFGPNFRLRNIRTIEDTFDSPKKTYNPELIAYYNEAISSTIPSHQYLSFYHILEYFYEKIFSEDQINKAREIITDVSFSYKRDKDIAKLIKGIQQKTIDKDIAINEKNALSLLIQKHIDQGDLKAKLVERNGEDYMSVLNTKVSFSDGNAIIFSNDESQFIKSLTERIYKTRNSIVHSKESFVEEKKNNKYKRIKDDKELLQEIALIQVMAEIMINEDSKPI